MIYHKTDYLGDADGLFKLFHLKCYVSRATVFMRLTGTTTETPRPQQTHTPHRQGERAVTALLPAGAAVRVVRMTADARAHTAKPVAPRASTLSSQTPGAQEGREFTVALKASAAKLHTETHARIPLARATHLGEPEVTRASEEEYRKD